MAKATLGTKTVERIEYDTVTTITLELTVPEARALKRVLGKVGGDPKHSPRKHTASVSYALDDAGVSPSSVSTTGTGVYFALGSDE